MLTVWTAAWALLHARSAGFSWHYFVLGAQMLASSSPISGGLHVYAAHPELQIGPLALLLAVPLTHLDPWHGRIAAVVLLTAGGPLLLAALARIRERSGRMSDPLLLVTGMLVLPVWTEVAAHFAHLDDALALAAIVAATGTIRRGSAVATGLLLAVATDSKPWAIGCAALLLALPAGRRARAAAVFVAGVALAWIPFVLGDPRTLNLGRFTIPNVAGSALNALGVHDPRTPSWDRAAQLLLGVAVAVIAVRRGRWAAVPLAVVCARLLLDPETYTYYTSGLLVATALVDLYVPARGFPMWTSAAALFYAIDDRLNQLLPAPALGAMRAGYCLVVLAVLALPGRQAAVTDAPVRGPGRHRRRRPREIRDVRLPAQRLPVDEPPRQVFNS
ncbi:hypothetical protein [Dactylosporangium darangshiense]|uniref:hypothetical protein n=1 Tax=Dactylosporangium darangshiense TaxID=579108 RepID=UPI0031ED537A